MNLLKNFFIFILLVGVVIASFWVSFLLGRRIIGPFQQSTPPKIIVEIPEPPPTIAGLQEKEEPEKKLILPSSLSLGNKVKKSGKAKALKRWISQPYYKVQAGLFNTLEEAKALGEKIQTSGFDLYIKKIGDKFRVQVGAFRHKTEAENLRSSLNEKGFSSFVIHE